MKLFTLYIGAGTSGELASLLARHFESFTLIQGQGFFHGVSEPVWMAKVATANPLQVIEAAEEIRVKFAQDGVGIEFASKYFRVTKTDSASTLKELIYE